MRRDRRILDPRILSDGNTLAEVLSISELFQDLPFDLADASVAEAAARLKIRSVLTIASDFDVHREKAGKPMVIVLYSRNYKT